MAEHPLISVIVPVYNGAVTLGGCLESLYASRDVSFEVIVVDDGSTDATRQVARSYPCRLLTLCQNMGAARAKNAGAAEATGDIIFFTDADVHVRPDTLASIAEDFRALPEAGHPQVTGVVGLLAETCPYGNFASQFKNLWMHFTYRRQPRRVGLFFTSAAAIRREVFLQEGGFDSHYGGASITEDIEFGQRLLSAGYQVIMDQRLTVEHHKRYTIREVLCTDLLRARGLAQTWFRNRLNHDQRAHYASVPWYFGAGVLALGLATALGLASFWKGVFLLGVVGAVALALALNAPFLAALGRWRGVAFLLQSMIFLLADLYVSGLGIALGLADFLTGQRY
jgi:GT2 family glycosyltransferase